MSRSPLISPEDLRGLLASGSRVVLLDARNADAAYDAGHLRGAIHASLDRDLSDASQPGFDPARGGRHPLPSIRRWSATLGAWGIAPSSTVIVYDETDGSNAAARAWWMLRAAGHEDVRVVDGGFAAAVEAGLPVDTDRPVQNALDPYPVETWLRPTMDIDDVDAARLDPGWRVLDVRSGPRYRGEAEPIDPVAGRIPGAVNLFFGENMRDGRFKAADVLRAQYEALFGSVPMERVIVHCGSGVTACHTLLALEAAGLDGAALYVGSWSEWCRNVRPRAGG
jgi:thiosulfate/3-mercaptopyruvate sulfurtransferase